MTLTGAVAASLLRLATQKNPTNTACRTAPRPFFKPVRQTALQFQQISVPFDQLQIRVVYSGGT
jgi:hypothetical protein